MNNKWVRYREKEYFFSQDRLSFEYAMRNCENFTPGQSRLLEIDSAEELRFVRSVAYQLQKSGHTQAFDKSCLLIGKLNLSIIILVSTLAISIHRPN